MGMEVIIAIDQGTSSTRAMAFDLNGHCLATAQKSIQQFYPHNGWVEQDAVELFDKTFEVLMAVVYQMQQVSNNIIAIGITNQRETTVMWDKANSAPVHSAIVWQDRRTSDACKHYQAHDQIIKQKTGLCIDPYFSASKIHWILQNKEQAKILAAKKQLAFGTIDSYLIWRLTNGKSHLTDITNASRTLLYNIAQKQWDPQLLDLFEIPSHILPKVLASDGTFGCVEIGGDSIPITGVVGDQQAAMVGQSCFARGDTKITFGTGAFLMQNTGSEIVYSQHLLSTIAYQTKHEFAYAVEGSIFNAGTIVKWLRDQLGLIDSAKDSETAIQSISDNGGVYFVPAFTGLGAPYWQPDVRATIVGLQLDTGKAHVIRAALESIAYQTRDLIEAMVAEIGASLTELKVDGGMCVNRWLMQFISDLCQLKLYKPVCSELTAIGAAMMACVGKGVVERLDDLKHWSITDWQLTPQCQLEMQYKQWQTVVARACLPANGK